MPAWQKRHPSVQPRAISTATRSWTISERASGASNFKVIKWMPRYLRWYRFAFGPKLTLDKLRRKTGA